MRSNSKPWLFDLQSGPFTDAVIRPTDFTKQNTSKALFFIYLFIYLLLSYVFIYCALIK